MRSGNAWVTVLIIFMSTLVILRIIDINDTNRKYLGDRNEIQDTQRSAETSKGIVQELLDSLP